MSDERLLAAELDRALAGDTAGAEARELAALLVAASQPLRFEVPADEVERALAAARPRPRRPLRLFRVAAAVAVLAAAALIWGLRTPGVDVQARAARAVDATFFFVEQVRAARPGLFPATNLHGYVDGRAGLAHVEVTSGAETLAETVVRPRGVERWLAASNTISFAPSCDAFAGGCAEVLDPLALYVRTIASGSVSSQRSGDSYRLTIRGARLDEVVVIDAHTYLPRRIEWREDGHLLATARFTALERQPAQPEPDAFAMSPHPGARVVQLAAPGRRFQPVAERAAPPRPGDLWLGRSYNGAQARTSELAFVPDGSARRITYGSIVVAVPPAVLQARNGPAKVFGFRGGVVHVYYGSGETVVADAELATGNVAVVSRSGDKEQTLRALDFLRAVPGSP